MKNVFIKTIAVLFAITIVSCSSQSQKNSAAVVENPTWGAWQDLEKSPIRFELEQTFGDDKEIIFSSVWRLQGPVADSKGNIYVIDGKNGSMYSFAPDGSLRWKKGKKGRGPGDFERPRGLVINDGYLYTANVSGTRIDKFDLDGNLVNSTTVESLGLSFTEVKGFINDSLLVTGSTTWGQIGVTITILNAADDLENVSQFKILSTSNTDLPKNFGFTLDIELVDSLIVAGNIEHYALQFYSHKGEKVKTVKRDFGKLTRPGFVKTGSSSTMSSYGSLTAPIALPGNYYLTALSWPINVNDPDEFLEKSMNSKNAPDAIYTHSMDLYSAEGILLYSLEEEGDDPAIGNIAYVDAEGNIYTKTNEPFPQIRRYSLTITSPNENEIAKESVELDMGG